MRFKNEEITLFSPHEVPKLYDAFFNDQEEFARLYEKYENSPRKKMKKKISAKELFSILAQERSETGRIYITNVDHANTHSSFKDPIKMSNLCVTGDTIINIKHNNIIKKIAIKDLNNIDLGNIEILSKNISNDTTEYNKILDFNLTRKNAKILKIHDIETEKNIKCTPEHKIYTKNRGYVEAKDLKESDILDIS